jgi:hypothetical protein
LESVLADATELRGLVDEDLLPAGSSIAAGEGANQHVAQVLPDGRLYCEGETFDGLVELSEGLGLTGNPWTMWRAELEDGPVSLNVLREMATG